MTLVADICCYCRRQLYVPFAQTAHHPAQEEGAKVGRCAPQRDTGNVTCHAPEESCPSPISVRGATDDGRCDGLKQGEEGAKCAPEKDNVIFGVDGDREGLLVGVEIMEYSVQWRAGTGVEISIEREKRWEEREDESERYLEDICQQVSKRGTRGCHTRSRSKETNKTLRMAFRLAGSKVTDAIL